MAFEAGKALLGTGLAGYLADRFKRAMARGFKLKDSAPYIDAQADAIVQYFDDEYSGGGDLAAVLAAGNDADGYAITNMADPSSAQDAATKNYVDGAIPATPTLAVVLTVGNSAGTKRITDVVDPSAAQDVATKNYVDGSIPSAVDRLCAIFEDERPYNTRAGGVTAAYWYARTLTNTVYNDDASIFELQRFAVVAVTTGVSGHIDVSGDQTAHFSVGRWFSVYQNTGYSAPNATIPTPLIISSVSYDGGTNRTRVYPTTGVDSATTVDGYLCTGRIVLRGGASGRKFKIVALPECCTYDAVAQLVERTGYTYTAGRVSTAPGSPKTAGWSVTTIASTVINMPCRIDAVITVAAGATEYWEVHQMCKTTSASGGLGDRSALNAAFTERYCRIVVEYFG